MDILSQEITIVIVGSAFFLLLAVGIVVLFLMYQKRQLRYILQKKELENQYQKELLNVQLEAREQTLKTVGMELHDNIGQVLSLAKLTLNKVNDTSGTISNTKDMLSKAIQDLRTLSKTLNSDYINKTTLADCLAYDVTLIQQNNIMQAELVVEGEHAELPNQSKLIVYRMAQELINNAVRHSQGTRIQVRLKGEADKFTLCVEDNGKGLAAEPSAQARGTGLGNLYVRASMVKGNFSMSNAIPTGTRAELTISLQA
jgi:two-component system, NarL family, sensor kinase